MRFYFVLGLIVLNAFVGFSQSEDQIAIEKIFNDCIKLTNENNYKAQAELIYPKTFDNFISKKKYLKAAKKTSKLYTLEYFEENTSIKSLPKVIADNTNRYAMLEFNFEIGTYFKKFDDNMISTINKVLKVYGYENVISDEENKRIKYRGTEKMYFIFDPTYNEWKTLSDFMTEMYIPKDILEDLNR